MRAKEAKLNAKLNKLKLCAISTATTTAATTTTTTATTINTSAAIANAKKSVFVVYVRFKLRPNCLSTQRHTHKGKCSQKGELIIYII